MLKKKFKAVMFDMDGIVINSEIYWEKIEKEYARLKGLKYTDAYRRAIMALSEKELAEVLRARHGLKETVDQIVAERGVMALVIYQKEAKLLPDFLSLIKKLRGKYKIALVSSSPFKWINPILRRFKIKKYFDEIVSAEEMRDGHGKPHPAIYLFAARRLKVLSKECLVFEDSVNGVKAAKAAGMFCVAVPGAWVKDRRGMGEADLVAKHLGDGKIAEILI
ncbi:MAG: HAD family phosphatase [Candidatus Magasanikbacteria bacterium]|nr:HAD family phosphatase [Candidatus Magasanikbacteria bacterium]